MGSDLGDRATRVRAGRGGSLASGPLVMGGAASPAGNASRVVVVPYQGPQQTGVDVPEGAQQTRTVPIAGAVDSVGLSYLGPQLGSVDQACLDVAVFAHTGGNRVLVGIYTFPTNPFRSPTPDFVQRAGCVATWPGAESWSLGMIRLSGRFNSFSGALPTSFAARIAVSECSRAFGPPGLAFPRQTAWNLQHGQGVLDDNVFEAFVGGNILPADDTDLRILRYLHAENLSASRLYLRWGPQIALGAAMRDGFRETHIWSLEPGQRMSFAPAPEPQDWYAEASRSLRVDGFPLHPGLLSQLSASLVGGRYSSQIPVSGRITVLVSTSRTNWVAPVAPSSFFAEVTSIRMLALTGA